MSHGGKGDVSKHSLTGKHKKALSAVSRTPVLQGYFIEQTNEAKNVAAAEGAFAYHSIKHHMSYNSATCSSKMYSKVFKDSNIACKFSSAKTKTEAIVNNVLAPHTLNDFQNNIKHVDFLSISTDASNKRYHKMFPVVVQYFDKNVGTQTKLIEFDELENETSFTISNYLLKTVKTFDISRKVVAFGGDNTNTNFGGLRKREGNNVFSHLKNDLECGDNLLGVGCPAHILHNTLHAGTDILNIDIETLVMKLFNHFSIYTVRVNTLKEFCDFVSVSYQDLLHHSKTRWLSIFPAVERVLSLFEPLQSYFLSIENCPKYLKSFFENPLARAYLHFLQSLSHTFQISILKIEQESVSVIEVVQILESVAENLKQRHEQHFVSLSVQEILNNLDDHTKAENFQKEADECYETCDKYLRKWLGSFTDLTCFKWMLLEDVPTWKGQIEETVKFLMKRGHKIDDSMAFNQALCLINFVKEKLNNDENDFVSMLASNKWVQFLKQCKSSEQYSELLKLAQFYFCLPGHNACVERIFSLMNSQWTDDRNRLKVESVKSILLLQYNFKEISCQEFHDYILKNDELLKSVSCSEKYDWYQHQGTSVS